MTSQPRSCYQALAESYEFIERRKCVRYQVRVKEAWWGRGRGKRTRAFNFRAFGFEALRVMARTANCWLALESFRMASMTEPPWAPVLPMTAMIFFSDPASDEDKEEDIVDSTDYLDVCC